MTFEKDQIKHLFIWVHPDYICMGESLLEHFNSFIDEVRAYDHAAIIHFPYFGREASEEYILDNSRSSRKADHYESIKKFRDIEDRAINELGERFLPGSNYPGRSMVEPMEHDHIEFLISYYNVTPHTRNDSFDQPWVTLFENISTFGETRDECVRHQRDEVAYLSANPVNALNVPPRVDPSYHPTFQKLEDLPIISMQRVREITL